MSSHDRQPDECDDVRVEREIHCEFNASEAEIFSSCRATSGSSAINIGFGQPLAWRLATAVCKLCKQQGSEQVLNVHAIRLG